MKCPYCEHEFPLTWGRYLSSPFGVYRCPQCKKKSRLSHAASYYAAVLTTIIVIFGSGILLPTVYFERSLVSFYGTGYNWVWAYGATMIFLVLDKFFDTRFRVLEKRNHKEEQVQE